MKYKCTHKKLPQHNKCAAITIEPFTSLPVFLVLGFAFDHENKPLAAQRHLTLQPPQSVCHAD